MALTELTLNLIAFRLMALLVLAAVHGGVIAGAAVLLGDRGPQYDGRLTAMPTSHMDTLGGIAVVIFGLGWSKPVALDEALLRGGRLGVIAVILAGFVALLALAALYAALILPALTMLSHSAGLSAAAYFRIAGGVTIWAAILSLIPVPPLAAGMLWNAFGLRPSRQVQWLIAAVLFAAIAAGLLRGLLAPVHAALVGAIFGT